ncbi:MAG: hypothetical protein C5S48_03850 [Candidatus Methanogaster sp.]|nr:MAG: hypothetical protein C5S48_03850 [ANME-2 cluster archaeon]
MGGCCNHTGNVVFLARKYRIAIVRPINITEWLHENFLYVNLHRLTDVPTTQRTAI